MPQTSDERRARWPSWDTQAIEHLESRGFVATRNYTWRNPKNLELTEKDHDAIIYLIEEFDWGGFE